MKTLFAGESNLQEVWDSRSSSNEDLKSRPMFLTSVVVAVPSMDVYQLYAAGALGTSIEEPLVLF